MGRYPGHTAPLDAIMRVPTRRQGRSRATYQSRVSGMRSSPRRERSPFPSLVSTTTAQPEDIKLALSGAEPPHPKLRERGRGEEGECIRLGGGEDGNGKRWEWSSSKCLGLASVSAKSRGEESGEEDKF